MRKFSFIINLVFLWVGAFGAMCGANLTLLYAEAGEPTKDISYQTKPAKHIISFLDEINLENSYGVYKNKKNDLFDSKPITLDRKEIFWKFEEKLTGVPINILNNSILKFTYRGVDLQDEDKIAIFAQKISEAIPKKPDQSRWVDLSNGKWSVQDDFIQFKKNSQETDSFEMIVLKKLAFRDGAIRAKFRFENNGRKGSESDFFGILFRMSKNQLDTGNAIGISGSGKATVHVLKGGEAIHSYGFTGSQVPIGEGDHLLEFFFNDALITVVLDGKLLVSNAIVSSLSRKNGFMGFIANTNVKVSKIEYSDVTVPDEPRGEKKSTSKKKNSSPNLFGINLRENDKDEYFYKINKDGSFEKFKNGISQKKTDPGFDWARNSIEDHQFSIIRGKDQLFILFDGVVVEHMRGRQNDSTQAMIVESAKSQLLGGRITKINDEADFPSIFKKIIGQNVLNNVKWKRNGKEDQAMVGELKINEDARRAILVETPSEVKFPVLIPPNAFLLFSLAIPKISWGLNSSISFEVILKEKNSDKENIIFSKEIITSEIKTSKFKDMQWLEFRKDLSKFKDFDGEIIYRTRNKSKNGENAVPQIAAWGNPTIFQERKVEEYNVILVSIDTLRSDHLGCYGYEKDITHYIDQIGEEGAVFLNTFSQAPWTLPSHLSMFTSLYPSAFSYEINRGESRHAYYEKFGLLNPSVSLPSILQPYNYITAAFTDGGFLDPDFGFSQGFNSVYKSSPTSEIQEKFSDISSWIKKHKKDKFFLFIHTYFTHQFPDYAKVDINSGSKDDHKIFSSEYGDPKEILDAAIDAYDGTIKVVDKNIGLLILELKKLGIYDKTLLVITSDHGESFGDHNGSSSHGHYLYNEEALKVPLILRLPNKIPKGMKLSNHVRIIDIQPTTIYFGNSQ